jgi:formylglycine-generating enzyme required for sulfatase activity
MGGVCRWLCCAAIAFASAANLALAEPMSRRPAAITNSIGMKFVWVPPGEYLIGSPESEPGRATNESQRNVRIARGFYLGACEVTQQQFAAVMQEQPSAFSSTGERRAAVEGLDTDDFPVESVAWDEAVEFCRRLNECDAEQRAGRKYRLPDEAEWEYACRAGAASTWSFGDDVDMLDDYAWFGRRASANRPHVVGTKKPNAWGLYDMHGNVWEWCGDVDMVDQHARIIRGGSWFSAAANTRCATRRDDPATVTDPDTGFRVLLQP